MSGVSEVTLSGTPTQAGTFKFKLTAQYKTSVTAEFTVTIAPYFNLYFRQAEPVDATHIPPRPREIFEGEFYRFEVYTDHPDGMSARLSWRVTGTVPGLEVKPLKGYTLSESPVITLEGSTTTAGTYWVTVTATDRAGHQASARFPIVIQAAQCFFSLRPQQSSITWDATKVVYPRAGAPLSEQEEARRLSLKVELARWCLGVPRDGGRVNISVVEIKGPFEFLRLDRVNVSTSGLYSNKSYVGLRVRDLVLDSQRPAVSLMFTFYLRDPLLASRPAPGATYTLSFAARTDSGLTRDSNVALRLFHQVPQLSITGLRPVSQLPTPNHLLTAPGGSDRLLVLGKQAVFRFNYTLEFPYEINVTIRLLFPSHEWDWRLYDSPASNLEALGKKGFNWFYISSGASGEHYIEETFTLSPTRKPQTRFFFAEKIEGLNIWLPAPKSTNPSVTLMLVKKGNLVLDPSQPLPFLEANRERISFTERFTALSYGANLKLGFYMMDEKNYTLNEVFDVQGNFPIGLKRYLLGMFPINVKEVKWMGFVGRPNNTVDSWAQLAGDLAEQIAEANLHRGIVIVPNRGFDFMGPGVLGVVFSGVSSSNRIAFVVFNRATDARRYEYFPVVAHELSHTLGYGDIYFGYNFPVNYCTSCAHYGYTDNSSSREACSGVPRVLGYWAFLDEVLGGLIRLGKYNNTNDIMACGGGRYDWAYHSWVKVAQTCSTHDDPPEGLLVSLIIYRNGTVVGRPFARLYNHSQPFPPTEVKGNSFLRLISRGGAVLRTYPFNFTGDLFKVYGTDAEASFTILVEVVEWFDSLGRVELVGPDGRVWFSRDVTLNEPKVRLENPLAGMKLKKGGTYVIRWSGGDTDGDKLWYNVQIRESNGTSWLIIAHRVSENSVSFTVPSDFKEGNYTLVVKATDGVNTGYDAVQVVILGEVPKYTLVVSSNVGAEIGGSGVYDEGSVVTLSAPTSLPMPGLLGFLGGRYVFQKWRGAVDTQQNPVSIVIFGEEKNLLVEAVYAEDLTLAYTSVAAVALAAAASALLAAARARRKRRKGLSRPSTPESPGG